jgi:hypothetical protein
LQEVLEKRRFDFWQSDYCWLFNVHFVELAAKEVRVVNEERLGNVPDAHVWCFSHDNLSRRSLEPA